MSLTLFYPELSYEIIGSLFEVHNELGNTYQEKYYQKAVEVIFKRKNIPYKREIMVSLKIDDEPIGKYFLDFLVDNKIVVELKSRPGFMKSDYKQVRAYLVATNLKLGILANFFEVSLKYKRILNPNFIGKY